MPTQKTISLFTKQVIEIIYDYRNIGIMLLVMAISIILRAKNYISGDNVTDLLKGTVIAFLAASGVDNITDAWSENKQREASAEPPADASIPEPTDNEEKEG